MPKSPETFDFSKKEDQEKFSNLPEKEKGSLIDKAQEKAILENKIYNAEYDAEYFEAMIENQPGNLDVDDLFYMYMLANDKDVPVKIAKKYEKLIEETEKEMGFKPDDVAEGPDFLRVKRELNIIMKDCEENHGFFVDMDDKKKFHDILSSPETSPKILAEMADNYDAELPIASNPNAPKEVLLKLVEKGGTLVKDTVARNSGATSEVLSLLAEDDYLPTRKLALENPNISKEVLDKYKETVTPENLFNFYLETCERMPAQLHLFLEGLRELKKEDNFEEIVKKSSEQIKEHVKYSLMSKMYSHSVAEALQVVDEIGNVVDFTDTIKETMLVDVNEKDKDEKYITTLEKKCIEKDGHRALSVREMDEVSQGLYQPSLNMVDFRHLLEFSANSKFVEHEQFKDILARHEDKFDKNSLEYFRIFGKYFPERDDIKLTRENMEKVLKKDNYFEKRKGAGPRYEHTAYIEEETEDYFVIKTGMHPREFDGASMEWRAPIGTLGHSSYQTYKVHKKGNRMATIES